MAANGFWSGSEVWGPDVHGLGSHGVVLCTASIQESSWNWDLRVNKGPLLQLPYLERALFARCTLIPLPEPGGMLYVSDVGYMGNQV